MKALHESHRRFQFLGGCEPVRSSLVPDRRRRDNSSARVGNEEGVPIRFRRLTLRAPVGAGRCGAVPAEVSGTRPQLSEAAR
jgi:hypothetical protein